MVVGLLNYEKEVSVFPQLQVFLSPFGKGG
jgi:hypothetical protein